MNETQIPMFALASVPTMITVLIGILVNNSRLSDMNRNMDQRFAHVDQRFTSLFWH
jgi:hypothetical protein